MSETTLLRQVLKLSVGAARLFRNSCGKFEDKTGRWIAFGLCKGSSDAIGWRTVVVTQEMVGSRIAQFVAIETKAGRWKMEDGQQEFIDAVRAAGGVAGVATSEEEAQVLLREPCGVSLTPR